jgi:CubicO group peptidase (beta-lactamase class C family)
MKASRHVVFVVATGFLLILGAGTFRAQTNSVTQRVDSLFARWDTSSSPGCALAIIQDGTIVHAKGFGMADLERDVPITPETVFYVGSVAKQFTGFSVGLLANTGRLSLDDDVRKYIPELPRYGRSITVRHLLHHTGGFRDYGELVALAGRPQDSLVNNDDVIALLSRQRAPFFPAGEEYLYSNSGYSLLASVVARASGTPFSAFTRQQIFEPLGMTQSHFHDDLGKLIRRRAVAYRQTTSGEFLLDTPNNARLGQGGFYTTVLDLAKWDQNFYDGRIGGQDLIRQMQQMPASMKGIPGTLNPNEKGEYGFGIFTTLYRGVWAAEHGGGMGGYRADLIRFPSQRFSVACLCNLGSIDPSQLVREVADIYLAEALANALKSYRLILLRLSRFRLPSLSASPRRIWINTVASITATNSTRRTRSRS